LYKFNVILADPPWEYKNKNTGGSMKSGAKNKYEIMSSHEISALREYLTPMLDDPCYLFLWSTNSHLEDACFVMWNWGFAFKTALTWVKQYNGNKMGMGFWFRGGTEHLLVGCRGKKVKPFGYQMGNAVISEALAHSKKPDWQYLLIEGIPRTSLGGQKLKPLELFARSQRKGWDALGAECDNNDSKDKDIRESLKEMQEILKIDNLVYE
jgi:N6-adenosine-specific RNA methylase IME4